MDSPLTGGRIWTGKETHLLADVEFVGLQDILRVISVINHTSQIGLFRGTLQVTHAVKACKQRAKEGWQRIF